MFFCVARENLRPRHAEIFSMPCACRGVKDFLLLAMRYERFNGTQIAQIRQISADPCSVFVARPSKDSGILMFHHRNAASLGIVQANLTLHSLLCIFAFLHGAKCMGVCLYIIYNKSINVFIDLIRCSPSPSYFAFCKFAKMQNEGEKTNFIFRPKKYMHFFCQLKKMIYFCAVRLFDNLNRLYIYARHTPSPYVPH